MAQHHSDAAPRPPRTVWPAGCTVAVAAALVAFLLAPGLPASATSVRDGDAELAAKVERLLPDGAAVGVSVALIDGAGTTQATLGTTDGTTPVSPSTMFETGSVQKVLTGTLLADMLESQDVELDTSLKEIWPGTDFADDAVAGITLEQLATHHAGLPDIRMSDTGYLLSLSLHNYFGADPYRGIGDPLQTAAGLTGYGPEADTGFAYSNLGFALLGQSLAKVAGDDYPSLLTERVLTPLGMENTSIPPQPGVPENGAHPHRNPSLKVQPSFNPANAPAGIGSWTTTEDLTKLLEAAMAGDAPALRTAQQPYTEHPGSEHNERGGLGWVLWNLNGTEIAWHNGATAGSGAFVAHTDDGRGVVVLANSSRVPVETIGLRLLAPEAPEFAESPVVPLPATLMGVFFAVGYPVLLLLQTARQRVTRWTPQLDRTGAASRLILGVALWVWSLRLGDAGPLALMWALGGGALALTAVLAAWRWPGLPLTRGTRPWTRWGDLAFALVIAAAVLYGVFSVLLRL